MAAILEDHLRKLHEIYSVSGASTRDQIDDFIKDIRHICLNEILERDKDLCCSTLFDQSFGIVSFLEKIVAQDEFQSSKAGLLELISEFTQKVEKKVLPFALDIKEICMSAYNRDKSAKVKNAAIAALAKVLELTVGSTLGEIMKIEKMIDKFMMELTKSSKLTATVKGSIYTLLGVITEVYPEYATVYSERLAGLYVNALKAEMTSKTKKPELSIIAGCLQGLTAFLVNFTQSVDEDSKYSYEIFKYARMAIDPSVEFTKYDVPRAGLHLFARHAGQFSEYLVDDYQNMYEKLQKWSHHHNRDVLHLGVSAMEAFLKQVSSTITERAKSRGNREGAIFKFFLQEFRDTMNNPSATLKEISLAVKGYGLLAAPCRIFLTQADVQFMFGEMMTKCEQEFLNTAQFVDEKLLSFPGFLHAVANIVKEISEVPETYALTLEQLLVVLLENLPKIHRPYHFTSLKAILYLLLSLQGKGNTFSKVLAGFVYQGLIRSCSHPVVIETQEQQSENSDETDLTVKPVTYRDFLELWSGLLESPSIKDFAKDDIGIEERRQLTQDLYDELMTAILKVIGKLDLSAIAREKEGELTSIQEEREGDNKDRPSANPLEGVEPSRPMDFQVFINLVDFCRDLLVQKHFQLFEKWVFTFTHTIIVHSTRFPLVSGFYKLLAVTMHIASELDFFKFVSASPATEIKNEMQMEEDGDGGDLSQVTYLLVSKFTKEVLVRMKQYRDDLLASCLTLIMALPKEIVAQQIKNIVPAIQLTFSMGLSYLPLAQIGLDALKRWSQMLPSEVLAPHYSSILPCLDSYLRTSDTGAEEVKIETVATASSKTSRRRKKLPIRIVRERKQLDTDKGYESQLSLVKQRILTYLGSLGGSVNYALLAGNEDEISRRAIAWDTYQHLRFDVPFRDIKPTIYFDPFLPRVVELARKSSDRQTKVAACELLHSLTLYTLGRTAQQPGDQQKLHSVENLYRKLFPALLSLACDVEQVCRQLFEPLVMQLIHWFTGNKMGESPETMALLDSMYDGLIQQEDTMLRDFSAQCLREFLTWSIKQTSRKSIEKNPVNVKSVLKRMFSYALHPSAFKRLGAALAFNSFYTVLREEDSLVDRFTFHILVHFVESLSIAHGDEKSLGTQEQCKKALENLERIIRQKADILRKQTGSRKEPAEWSKQTLDIAVRWLVRQCGRPQTECRHACMKLVYRLASLITGIKSPQEYFTAFLTAENGAYFVIRFEGGGHTGQEKGGLLKFPTLDRTAERFSLQNVLIWCDTVLAALDCYCWVFGEELLSPESVFTDYKEKSSCLFESLIYFVEKLALGDLHDAARQFPGLPDSFFFTPRELDDYNRAKCTLIVRIWNFLTVLLAKYTQKAHKVIPHKLLSKTLWKLCVSCVLKPSSVGFNMGDIEITMNLPKEMIQVLRVLSKCLPDFQKKELLQTLGQELQQHDRDVFGQLPVLYAEAKTHYMEFKQTVEGYSQLHSVGLLLPAIGKSGCHEKLAKDLFDCVFQGITKKNDGKLSVISLNPAAQSLASCLLDFSFQLKLQPEDLVKSLLDSTPVHGLGQGVEHSWGDRFFLLFKSNVSSHLASNPQIIAHLMRYTDREPHRVCSILATMLDHMAHDRDLRKMQGQKIVQEIVSHWEKLKPWWETGSTVYHHGLLVLLLTKLLIIDSKVMINVGNPSFDLVLAMYRSLLTDKKTNLAFKNRVLDLLPFFAAVPKPHEDKLRESLDRFVADNFPLKSSELARGTPTYNDYITSIDKLLSALELSDSLMLLELLISVFCREEGRHAHQDAIQESLANFICRLPGDKQKPALEVPFKIFCSEGSFSSSIRRATIEQACLPIMHIICKAALIEFFLDNIIHLMSIVDVKLSKGPESVLESQLTSKLCCFQLLEVMYSRLSREEVNSQESEINRRACFGKPETGKEMTQKITKTVSEAKSEDVRGETMLVELRRQYHCYSYNLLMAIICCVQNDSKFYKGFLFQDNVAKGQFLLDNIIDKDKKYEFPMEFESRFERKKKFVAIRNKVREKRTEAGDASSLDSDTFHMASQYLQESSLSEDFNKYDFSMSGSAQHKSAGQRTRGSLRKKPSYTAPDEKVLVKLEGDFIELEMDELNAHECMPAFIALLKHMQKNNIFPPPQPGVPPKEMPAWMTFLHDKMKSSASDTLNVKLFIGKLIINTAEIFQPFAKFWLRPMCQLILSSGLCDGGINYFIVDLVVTMLSWHDTAIPHDSAEERSMASRLVEFLVAKVYHENRSILRNNLEMLKTLLECWKERIEIPYHEVYNQLKMPDTDSLNSLTGIQVLGVILACKFSPYGPSAPVDRDKFLATLAASMTNKYRQIYPAAAEVIGMVLAHLAEKEMETDGNFHAYIESCLGKVKPDSFIICVHHIQRYYPPIADRFLNKLLFMLPSLHGEFRAQCLEVILNRADSIPNIYLELQSKGLFTFLKHRDETTQTTALRLVYAMAPKLTAKELHSLMTTVTDFNSHPSASCRHIMFDILMWLYDNYRDNVSDEGVEIMKLTKETLLQGLCDEDLACRLIVQNFWSSEIRLPEGTLDRTVAMLEAMYSPGSEQHYLSYSTNLLLEMTSKSPDYQRQIFEHPLSECTFRDYSVQSSWRQRHAVMTPLFAVTQVSQSMDTMEDSVDGQLRSTQEVQQFTATVDPGVKAPFNWLTQSSLDTFADYSMSSTETQSSLLFTVGSNRGGLPKSTNVPRSRLTGPRSGFGQSIPRPISAGKQGSSKNDEDADSNDLWQLKRRFMKDRASSQVYFARRQIRLKKMKEEVLKQQRLRRENQVTLYRKYRIGDLPDIQIQYSAIIAPLQALAQCDATVAKLLFSAVFKAIYQGMDKVKTEREMEEIRNQINTSLNQMLANSTLYYPPLMACVMDIFYNMHASLKVSSMDLGTAAVVSNLQPLGIEVMEEHLIQEESNPRTAKRGRFECASLSQDVPLWYELARLYKSVREYDVLHGIFNGVLNTKEITHRAMVAESHGNFKEAKMLYDEAIECAWEEKPLDVEIDFWDESRMECLNRMTLWKDLESVATDGVRSTESSSLDNVWKDTFSMETYLPYLMRSKLKLMLQGDTTQQSLLTFIDESMKDAEHKAHLENRFSGELALVAVWQSDYGRARHYARLATQQFLQEWSSTDSLLVTARAQILQHLQPLVELQEFLDFMGDGNLTSLQPSFKLTTTWERRSPHLQLDAVDIWDDVITNRNVFLDKISHYVQSSDSLDFDQETDAFQDIKLKFKLKMAESCKEQNNFSLSLKILKETFKKCKQDESKTRLVEWSHLYASLHHKKALSRDGVWTDETLYNVLTTLDQLGKVSDVDLLLQRSDLHLRQSMLTGQAYDVLLTGITETNTLDVLTAKTSEKLKQYAGTLDLDCNKLMQQLVVKGFHAFRNALSDDYESLQSGSSLQQCDLQLELAKYCDKYLRFSEEDETLLSKRTLGSFPETAVKCLLDSMRMGSEEARERFPCLLQIIEQNPDTMGLFIRKADTVPCWMFILWISQMMALMDKPQAPAVRPILLRIAAEYPQAVVYPFHISQEGFTFGSAETDKKNREGVERLADLLSEEKVPWVSKLISALDQFGQPFQLFKDWSDDMQKLLAKSSRSIDVIKTKYQEMYNMLVNIPETATDSLSIESSLGTLSTTILMGDFRRRFAKVFKKDFDVYFGKDGQKLTTMTLKEFCGMFRKVQEQFEKIKDKREMMPPSKIGEYCPWMETFNPNRDGRDLEIPGQYDGLRKPMPEYHVKVAGFDERVLVMSSIRKPKRITIRGNDEKDYHYLVKGGEDLRQDQRIEQLFLQMNKVLQKDPACRSRSLKVKTYQVIPMTPRVGLIEWMNNTCPLKEFLLDAMTDSEKAYFHGEQGPSKQHHKWTSKCQETGKRTHGGMYSLVFQKYSKTETVKEFRIKEGKVPWNLSRRALQQMSTSPEAFHVLRCELLTSHAVLSICQYLLGIGDRHLSNFMINLKTGQMVGIDFGHAFGTATQFLPIPELMAIRLTRQIVNVGLPLKTKGLLENTMVYVLRALRRNHDLLLATMDVFVKEVSVDWKQFAEKQINEGKEPEDAEENVAWYPKQKIMSAARKLKGDNPCCITRDELRLGHGKNPALKAFETVTMGDPQENIRAQLPHTDLNEEDQVAALIDQATDPNILGRTWAGWEPWV